MKKTFLKAIKTFFAAAALLGLAACSDLSLNSNDAGSPVAAGQKASVTFNLSAPGRTVFPTVDLSDYAYKVAVDSGTEADVTVSNGTTSAIEVSAGEHTFTVNGYKTIEGTSTKVLTGSTTATISTTSTALNVVLKGAEGSTGTITATLNVGAELGVTAYKVGVGTSLPMAVPDGDARAVSNDTVTYEGSAASGTTQYVVFFLYDSESHLVCPYTFPMYVVAGLTTTATETLTTATFTATVTVTKDSAAWNDSGLEITLVNASDSSDTITMTTTSGTNTYTANAIDGKTYKVYVGEVDKGLTLTKASANATLDYTSSAVYPNLGATNAYADTYFEITFDSAPTINRASTGTVRICKADGTVVDTIKPAAETMYGYGVGGNSSYGEINAQYQLIQAIGNKVRIIPHHGSEAAKATLLENETSYYIVVDDGIIDGTINTANFKGIAAKEWTFTTDAAPSVSNNTLTVGTDKNFITVQGAFSYLMANSKSGDWTIEIDKGTYYERIFYSGSANITMSGQTTTEFGTDVEIQWCNQDGGDPTKVTNTLWNYGSRGRNVFYFAGANLVLENLSIINTATRKSNEYGEHDSTATGDNANGNNQAEALMFDSTGNCAAYNCNFTSKQDTIYLSPSGGKAWFYGCKISGDVDFIWGESDVALFEKCDIISAYDSDKSSNHVTYVVAPHLHNASAPFGKGFVLYNSTIATESGQTTYLARSPWGTSGNVSQVAIIDTAVTGGLESSPWYGDHAAGDDETVLGWKWYGVTSDGSAIGDTYKITQAQYEAEFAGRRNIINRVYNGTAFEKDTVSNWDINALATARSWDVVADNSKETLSGETEVTSVVYDFAALTGYTAQSSYVSSVSPATGTGDDVSLSNNWKWHGNQYGLTASGSSPWTITVPVTGACTIAITNSYTDGSPTVTLPASTADVTTLAANTTETYTYTGAAGSLTFSFTASGTFYISKIIVTYTSTAASDVVISDGSTITDSDTNKNTTGITVKLGETPTGYAGVGYEEAYADTTYTTVTVSNRADLISAAKAGNKFIIVDGMIDMTDGMLPSVGGGSTEALDTFVSGDYASQNQGTLTGSYANYLAWQEAYAKACTLTTNDKSTNSTEKSDLNADLWVLSNSYKKIIQLNVASNTTIVGKDANSGIKGANISISGMENVVLRNLIIQDAYDPFPHHEKNDGYNAQWDCITIQGNSKYVWIDHCTIQDTLTLAHVYTNGNKTDSDYKEKWQTYDGLLDIKGLSQYITVSNCKFKNHDKTSLIGNEDTEGNDAEKRLITYHHNYFYNCGQRLPMMRNGTFHLYNNYYAYSDGYYEQGYAMGIRAGSTVYAENNCFGAGIYAAFSADSDSVGTLYASGNSVAAGVNEFNKGAAKTGETKFSELTSPAYTYDTTTVAVADVPTNAGTASATIKDKSETVIVDGGGTSGEGITAIAFSAAGKTIVVGDTFDLTKLVTLTPSTADVSDLTWTVESGTSATVSDGVVTASSTAGDTVVKAASTADATVSATFTVTVVENTVQLYDFAVATYNADNNNAVASVISSSGSDATSEMALTNFKWQNANYGVTNTATSGNSYMTIPTSGADSTVIVYITNSAATNELTLSDVSGYSKTRVLSGLGSTKGTDVNAGARGAQAYAWRYTGGETSVKLAVTIGGSVYIGRIVVTNDFIPATASTMTFDFTDSSKYYNYTGNGYAGGSPFTSFVADEASSAKLYVYDAYTSGTEQSASNYAPLFWHGTQYGAGTKGSVSVTFAVAGACTISQTSGTSQRTWYLYDVDGNSLDYAENAGTLTYNGDAGVLTAFIDCTAGSTYFTTITVSPAQ